MNKELKESYEALVNQLISTAEALITKDDREPRDLEEAAHLLKEAAKHQRHIKSL